MTRTSSSFSAAVLVILSAAAIASGQGKAPPKVTEDGLVLVEDRDVAVAWVRPDVELSAFKQIFVPEIEVSFRDGWETDNRVSTQDSKRIRKGFGDFYRKALLDYLRKKTRFEVVDGPGDGVLRFECKIVNLDMTASENPSAGRSRSLMSSMGSAVLAVEVFDSGKGYIHARALDPIRVFSTGLKDFGGHQENGNEARRVIRAMAKTLDLK
jgi:hypothetical protein